MHDDELLRCFAVLERATCALQALERRLSRHPDSVVDRRRSLAACEQVLQARAALYRCLIRQGWQPPSDAVRRLLDDELLLDEPSGPIDA